MADALNQQARERVVSFNQRLSTNPTDAEALYGLSVCYANGWGVNQDPEQAKALLEQAAQFGQLDAIRELEREKFIIATKQKASDRDMQQIAEAEHMVKNKIGLEEAIKKEIFPCVVSLKTNCGVIGTGFYQHSDWLVSNAHVLPSHEILISASLIDFKNQKVSIGEKRAFHRPSEISTSPDIVIMEGNLRSEGNCKSIPTKFSDDKGVVSNRLFYVYFNHETQTHEIKYLISHSQSGNPLTYECEDGIEPQFGCSGAPVIEARVSGIDGHELKWQFRTVGIIYARCVNNQDTTKSKLACAIPVAQEFLQILQTIIFPQMHAKRANDIVQACARIEHGRGEAARYESEGKIYTALAENGLKEFKAGQTSLNIELPDGLEQLLGREIMDLSESAFIPEIQAHHQLEDRFHKLDQHSLQELVDDFNDFLEYIKQQEQLVLRQCDKFLLSPKEYFRVDITGGTNVPFKLDIQDNIGRREHTTTGSPISSVFAIVKVPKEEGTISGVELADLFRRSQEQKKAQDKRPIVAAAAIEPELSRKDMQRRKKEKKAKGPAYMQRFTEVATSSPAEAPSVTSSTTSKARQGKKLRPGR